MASQVGAAAGLDGDLKALYNQITLGMIQSLEKRNGVVDVKLLHRASKEPRKTKTGRISWGYLGEHKHGKELDTVVFYHRISGIGIDRIHEYINQVYNL